MILDGTGLTGQREENLAEQNLLRIFHIYKIFQKIIVPEQCGLPGWWVRNTYLRTGGRRGS